MCETGTDKTSLIASLVARLGSFGFKIQDISVVTLCAIEIRSRFVSIDLIENDAG
jgi:hypothetical protein